MCKEKGGSGILQNVKRRTSSMVPSSVKRYRKRAKERKAKHRLSFDFENPTLGQNESTTIEMVSTSGFGMSGVELDGLNEGEVKVVEQGEVKVSGAGGATSKKKKNYLKSNRKLRISRGKKKQGKNQSPTPAQCSRRKTMNRVTTKLQSLNRNNNETGLPNSTTNPIVENHSPVMMDEATGKKYYHDLKTGKSTWLVEEGDSATSTESPNETIPDQGTEIQILEDENGRRYSWNPITEETAWLDRVENGDEQEESSSYDASGGNLFGGTNPMHVIKSTEETKERDRKN
jgi:hypothetical protein